MIEYDLISCDLANVPLLRSVLTCNLYKSFFFIVFICILYVYLWLKKHMCQNIPLIKDILTII